MKKSLILPALTLATILPSLSGNLVGQVSAIEENETYGKLRTMSEVAEIYQQYEAIRDSECADGCNRSTFFQNFIKEHREYIVLSKYINATTFIITAVNPEQNSFRAFFRDLNLPNHERKGQDNYRKLLELYIGWVDLDTTPTSVGSAIRAGTASAGVHTVLATNEGRTNEAWFPPNQENSLSTTLTNLLDDPRHTLYFTAFMDASSQFSNSTDYSSCFEAGYAPGMNLECRLRFNENGDFVYLPYEIEPEPEPVSEPTPEPAPTPEPDIEPTAAQEPASEPTIVARRDTFYPSPATASQTASSATGNDSSSSAITLTVSTNTQETTTKAEDSAKNSVPDLPSNAPLATNAVSLPKSGECEDRTIFPWWFILLVLAADAMILWLFWPNRQKSPRIPKNPQ